MQIAFSMTPEQLVALAKTQEALPALVAAVLYEADNGEVLDLLNDMYSDSVEEWVRKTYKMEDLFDSDDAFELIDADDISEYASTNWDLDDVTDLLQAYDYADVLRKMRQQSATELEDAIKAYSTKHGLNVVDDLSLVDNATLLTTLQERLRGNGIEADDVLDILTQSNRLSIQTVYYVQK